MYEKYFAYVEFVGFTVATNTLTLGVPNWEFAKNIEKEDKVFDALKFCVLNTFGKVGLVWKALVAKETPLLIHGTPGPITPPITPEPEKKAQAPGTPASSLPPIDSRLSRTQTFSNFFEASSNRLSRSIGLRIAQNPSGTQFNPMFVFGESGCGKTHLVNAIGNLCKAKFPSKRILYVTARQFQVQYTNANREGKINDFIAFYQTIDMLIVDDVQDWMQADKTQNTFFHIFNHLHRNERRIILVSDRPPVEMEGMSRRLLTRFSSGLLAEMERPNEQLCMEILKNKVGRDGTKVPLDVMQYIARHANGSVRDLEGIINSLMAFSVVYNCNIDMKLVERVLKRTVKMDDQPLTVDDILNSVCRHYEVTPNNVRSKSRKKNLVLPRQLTMFLVNRYTNIPSTRIGKLIGNRDHSTVLHSIAAIEEALKSSPDFADVVKKIEESLNIKQE